MQIWDSNLFFNSALTQFPLFKRFRGWVVVIPVTANSGIPNWIKMSLCVSTCLSVALISCTGAFPRVLPGGVVSGPQTCVLGGGEATEVEWPGDRCCLRSVSLNSRSPWGPRGARWMVLPHGHTVGWGEPERRRWGSSPHFWPALYSLCLLWLVISSSSLFSWPSLASIYSGPSGGTVNAFTKSVLPGQLASYFGPEVPIDLPEIWSWLYQELTNVLCWALPLWVAPAGGRVRPLEPGAHV